MSSAVFCCRSRSRSVGNGSPKTTPPAVADDNQSVTSDDAATALDPVVCAALTELRSWTYHRRRIYNLRLDRRPKNLTDPSSRSGAIHIFKNLKYHGYSFRPDEVQKWAAANRWRPADARRLADYAEGVLAGRRYHCVPDPFGTLAIDRWRAAAAQTTS